jgi:hypothetical protein
MPKYYYITKYALSKGILYEECAVSSLGEYLRLVNDQWMNIFKIGRDAFETYEEAHRKAVFMRDKKIKSLKKQLTRLEKLRFDDAGKDNG